MTGRDEAKQARVDARYRRIAIYPRGGPVTVRIDDDGVAVRFPGTAGRFVPVERVTLDEEGDAVERRLADEERREEPVAFRIVEKETGREVETGKGVWISLPLPPGIESGDHVRIRVEDAAEGIITLAPEEDF